MVLFFHFKHIPHTLYKYISTHATFHIYHITFTILCLCTNQGNGDAANGDTFSLQELYDFVQRMLFATEETKMTLRAEIEEARYALRPWPIETIVMRQLDRDTCTCEEVRRGENLLFLPSGPKVPLSLPAPDRECCIFGLTRQKNRILTMRASKECLRSHVWQFTCDLGHSLLLLPRCVIYYWLNR